MHDDAVLGHTRCVFGWVRSLPVGRTLAGVATRVDQTVGWSRLPTPLGLAVLIGLRSELRARNLTHTGTPPGPTLPEPTPADLATRTIDGTYNCPATPRMGAAGNRFGRNIPLEDSYPQPPDEQLLPNPRLISLDLLRRDDFIPATGLNLLAAAWIQFEVHDWFNHRSEPGGPGAGTPWEIPRPPGDPDGTEPITMPRSTPDPTADPDLPPAYTSTTSHWWDASQIYGDTPEYLTAIRTGQGGKTRIDDDGLPPADTDDLLPPNGTASNSWVGLTLLHSLFLREHNAICDRLARAYPDLTDDQLFATARLINAALIAKIHTIEWTTAIIAHPTTVAAMRGNWFGVLGEDIARRFGHLLDNPVLSGIPGSHTDFDDVPYALTEEFVAVYRMHPLMPDGLTFRNHTDDAVIAEHPLAELFTPHSRIRERLREATHPDLLYSLGRAHPGQLTLHNYPRALQSLSRTPGEHIDLASVDILRNRERGVPRYNDFRRLFRMAPASSFDDLTDNPQWARELEKIYDDIEQVDLLVGLYAEPKPKGFAFSDTAFRVFIVMASRRLSCDRFFTDDFRPEIYTEVGMAWIRDNTMRTVLLRHYPTLAPALRGVDNAFTPWNVATARDSTARASDGGHQ